MGILESLFTEQKQADMKSALIAARVGFIYKLLCDGGFTNDPSKRFYRVGAV